jgi:hypothetical protein
MRTATMTVEQCEAELGPRGSTIINSDNRGLVRKWLVAKGFPSLITLRLSMTQLSIAYNGRDDSGLDIIRTKMAAVETANEAMKDFKAAREAGESFDEDTDEGAYETAAEGVAREQENAAAVTQANADYQAKIAAKMAASNTAATSSITVTGADPAGQVQHIARLLGQLLASGSCNTDQVKKIVAGEIDALIGLLPELVAKHAHVTRLELVKHDGSTHTVEGHIHAQFPNLIKAMSSRQTNGKHPNTMIIGPTGSGKTHGVEMAAKALGLEFYTNGAISMDHQVIGFRDANGHYHETPFRKAFGNPAVYLFDEADASDNSPLLCLAGALANSEFDFPDTRVARHHDSVIIAAGNTWGDGATNDFVGRNKLDGAFKSRFPVRITWDYDESLERAISGNVDWACRVQKARAAARRAGLKVIIDPRMTQAGAALIASGMTFDTAAQLTYLANLTEDQRKMVEA